MNTPSAADSPADPAPRVQPWAAANYSTPELIERAFNKNSLDYRWRTLERELEQDFRLTNRFGAAVGEALGGLNSTAPVANARAQRFIDSLRAVIADKEHPDWQKLMTCTSQEILDAAVALARLGVPELNEAEGFGRLVVVRDAKGSEYGPFRVLPHPGERGLAKLIYGTRTVKSIQSAAVYEQDEYTYQAGGDNDPVHKRNLRPDEESGNEVYAAYCRVLLNDGAKHVVEMAVDPDELPEAGRRAVADVAAAAALQRAARDLVYLGRVTSQVGASADTHLYEALEMIRVAEEAAAKDREIDRNLSAAVTRGAPPVQISVTAAKVPEATPGAEVGGQARDQGATAGPSAATPDRATVATPAPADPIQRSMQTAKQAAAADVPAKTPAAPAAAPLPTPTAATGRARRI